MNVTWSFLLCQPRNMLLDADGNMRLCDFGLSYQFKKENEVLKNVAGTDSYNAPEMINKQTYRFSVDIWSMGVCLFEMIFRKRPYKSDENMINCHQKNIELNFPDFIPSSDSVRNLLNRMLQFRPKNRIGCGPNGVKELKEHPWLRSIDWESIRSRKLKPPFVPREEKRGTTMVDKNIFHKDNQKRGNSGFLDSGAQQRFQGFEYNVALHSEDHAMLPPPVRKKNEKRILRTDLSKLFKESLKPR
ncbi:Ribosomal protein S6 kinase alpha-6, partial [Bonamia ostreae]